MVEFCSPLTAVIVSSEVVIVVSASAAVGHVDLAVLHLHDHCAFDVEQVQLFIPAVFSASARAARH